jgi:hypothetical protein
MTTLPPLLQIVQGKKVRPRKAPAVRPLELDLHMASAKLLRQYARPHRQWTHVGHGEVRDVRTAAKLKQMGLKRGWPDFVLVPPTGQLHCLELKRTGAKLSPDQEVFRLWCIRHGVPHSTCRTLDEVLTALDSWGCLRISVHAGTGGAA